MKNATRTFYETAVRNAVEHVFHELDDALDLTELARAAALSPLHFHHIFRGMLGETPLELHRRLRMERAAWQIATGNDRITRVAFDAGYVTHESFTRAFGEHYGLSPIAFRQSASERGCDHGRGPRFELAARCGIHFHPDTRQNISPILTKGDPNMHVEIKELPGRRIAAVRHTGSYNRVSEAFQRLGDIATRAGLIRHPGTEMIALYHDDPETTPVDRLRSDAGLTVPNDVPLPEGVTEIRIRGGRYACATHAGPYTGLGDAWAQFMGNWLPTSHHRVGEGPSFEIYRNDPTTTSSDKLITELYLPLAS